LPPDRFCSSPSVHGPPHGIARQGGLAVSDLPDQLLGRKILDDLVCVHPQRTERSQPGVERRVVDSVGVEFEVNPPIDAHLRHAVHVARPRAEGQPVQRVQGALLAVHRAGLLLLTAKRHLGRKHAGDEQSRRQQPTAPAPWHFHSDWPH
jgi:hypothetical protein